MSDTDPYAGPTVEVARKPLTLEKTVAETPVVAEEPVVETALEVPEGSAATVLAWVGDDKERAQAALDAEAEGQKRTTLTHKLKAIVD
jgi:hypothetical protein